MGYASALMLGKPVSCSNEHHKIRACGRVISYHMRHAIPRKSTPRPHPHSPATRQTGAVACGLTLQAGARRGADAGARARAAAADAPPDLPAKPVLHARELQRVALAILREAGEPLPIRVIAARALALKDCRAPTRRIFKMIRVRLQQLFGRLERKGLTYTVGRMRRGGDWRDRNEVLTYRPSRSRHGPHMTEYRIVPDGSKGFGVELISPTRFLSVRGFATELDAQVWTDAQEASEAVAKEGDEVGPARGKVIPSVHGKAHPRSIARARVSNSSA
jgi:hypothetical protein